MGGPEGVELLACSTADGQQLRLHLMILAHTDPSEGSPYIYLKALFRIRIWICKGYGSRARKSKKLEKTRRSTKFDVFKDKTFSGRGGEGKGGCNDCFVFILWPMVI